MCDRQADFEIYRGINPDNDAYSCSEHLGQMVPSDRRSTISPTPRGVDLECGYSGDGPVRTSTRPVEMSRQLRNAIGLLAEDEPDWHELTLRVDQFVSTLDQHIQDQVSN